MSTKRSKNALKHGLHARDAVLEWESESDFKDLHDSIREEFRPDGALEEETVFDLTVLHWKKRRLHVASQLGYHRQPDSGALAEAGSGGWPGVTKYLKASGDGDRLVDALRATARSHVATVQKVYGLIDDQAKLLATCDPSGASADLESRTAASSELQRLISLMKELNVMNKELIVPVLGLMENYDLDENVAARAYRPDIIGRHLKIEADIDKRIEKAITRLVTLKEYKKLYGEKAASAPEVINLTAKRMPPSED